MSKLACPACGAEVKFTSRVSTFAVCPYCHSTLIRQDLKLEHLGEMAVLQEDASPLQLGTSGKFKGVAFTLIGRLQMSWEDGNWNEWFMYFDGEREGWLGEAQGFYMVSFALPEVGVLPPVSELTPGRTVHLAGKDFTVQDVKQCRVSYSAGELPFRADYGRVSTSIDLSGENNGFACIDAGEEGTRVYIGEYQDFTALQFQFLREFDGW